MIFRFWQIAPLLAAFALSGCIPVPDANLISAGSAFRPEFKGGKMPPPGDWWKAFQDSSLDELMARFEANNPSLQAAMARRDQAHAALGLSSSPLFPTINGNVSGSRKRDSLNGLFVPNPPTYSQFEVALNLQYEIDLWGRVRKSVLAARGDYLASEGDLAAAILSLKTSLARNWYQYRYVEDEIDVIRETVGLRQENLNLIQAKVEAGDAAELELARAESERELAQAQLLELQRSKDEFFNALAALVGTTPGDFHVPKRDSRITTPQFPAGGVPSVLLDRRPDVFAARQRVEAAAARIGVTKANYFPRFTIGGTGGLSSLQISDLFDANSWFGRIGPNISIPIFAGGQLGSDFSRAEASGREALAQYREAVLAAVRDAETSASDASWLDRQIVALQKSAHSASKASNLSRARYRDGLVNYLEVIDTDRTALAAERELIRARAARQFAAIRGVQALGGGWAVAMVEAEEEKVENDPDWKE